MFQTKCSETVSPGGMYGRCYGIDTQKVEGLDAFRFFNEYKGIKSSVSLGLKS